MNRRQKFCGTHVLVWLSALVCLLLCPCILYAQGTITPAQAERIKEREMQDREYALYHAGEAPPEQRAEQVRSVLPQIQEDFKQMQLVNNEMMKQVVAAPALDYKLITHSVAEINKRAARLKENLGLLQIKEGNEKETHAELVMPADDKEVKTTLLHLDNLIMSFINNPQFKDTSVVAVQHANRAGRDLHDIIELSRLIKKGVERLNKAAPTTP
jgi:hypothetical protein